MLMLAQVLRSEVLVQVSHRYVTLLSGVSVNTEDKYL